jgi:hypothetical protein
MSLCEPSLRFRETGFAGGVIIESLDDLSLSERWTRDVGGWKSIDA